MSQRQDHYQEENNSSLLLLSLVVFALHCRLNILNLIQVKNKTKNSLSSEMF